MLFYLKLTPTIPQIPKTRRPGCRTEIESTCGHRSSIDRTQRRSRIPIVGAVLLFRKNWGPAFELKVLKISSWTVLAPTKRPDDPFSHLDFPRGGDMTILTWEVGKCRMIYAWNINGEAWSSRWRARQKREALPVLGRFARGSTGTRPTWKCSTLVKHKVGPSSDGSDSRSLHRGEELLFPLGYLTKILMPNRGTCWFLERLLRIP